MQVSHWVEQELVTQESTKQETQQEITASHMPEKHTVGRMGAMMIKLHSPTFLQSEDFSGNLWLETVVFPKAEVFASWGKKLRK